ncbi:phage holin family protein [Clostridium beijerinckii]|jgi:toxin secretion/phage lysis holin|uniref:phage holin family protein n=1 Tax=Clostridium beijerinckii TaxID=1520 RepID=UPI0013618A00|nr:phage holin family protein [Clostridium beijerinckii]MZK51883.1 holin [Clostridium beijerinckii]MZK58500.1 holin [Clostridium beijerinckii]MZK68848.1 holin [Clostridium beijerinckii]MZK74219.1 holin [Clostridium beijerinckii]MZK83920.1 holin [Clostridium beijerinckii]
MNAEKANEIKGIFYGTICIAGGFLGPLLGGWDKLIYALIICSIIDYFSGGAVALIFKNSPKTETGAAKSNVGFKGLVKKIFIYLMIIVVVQIDIVVNSNGFLRNAAILGFMANEVLSIVENLGLMGIKMPDAVTNAIDILKIKSQEKE